MALRLKLIFQIFLIAGFVYFAQLMVLITLQYVPLNFDVTFLQLKTEINLLHYQIAFFTHVYSSIFVLLLGFVQFIPLVRKKHKKTHRLIGILYVLIVLFLAAPSGLVMGYYGNGGFYSQLSFCLQAVLWFAFTLIAFRYAKKGDFIKHSDYMTFSYALTLSAMSLRLFKWIIVGVLESPPMETYK
ncbi:MAG: DUF2306 domain-containing protein, partial [Bacteroidota bacterium]